MEKIFTFQQQNTAGKKGESDFIFYYGGTKSTDLSYDILLNGQKIELKTDFWESQNFFIERYSNMNKLDDGGPFRSLLHKIDSFVYYFIKEKMFYWFDPQTFCPFLNKLIETLEPKYIKNRNYETCGFLVKRDLCSHLALKIDKF